MAESIQEDVYSLGQAKKLIERLRDEFVYAHPSEVDGEKYKYHLKKVVEHLDDALKERSIPQGQLWR